MSEVMQAEVFWFIRSPYVYFLLPRLLELARNYRLDLRTRGELATEQPYIDRLSRLSVAADGLSGRSVRRSGPFRPVCLAFGATRHAAPLSGFVGKIFPSA